MRWSPDSHISKLLAIRQSGGQILTLITKLTELIKIRFYEKCVRFYNVNDHQFNFFQLIPIVSDLFSPDTAGLRAAGLDTAGNWQGPYWEN